MALLVHSVMSYPTHTLHVSWEMQIYCPVQRGLPFNESLPGLTGRCKRCFLCFVCAGSHVGSSGVGGLMIHEFVNLLDLSTPKT